MMHPARRLTAVLAALSLLTACSGGSESSTPTMDSGSSSTSGAQVAEAEPAVATPMLARVLSAPIPVPMTDGKVHLAYELDLTNALGQDLDLRSVTVTAGDRSLLTLSGDDLASRTRILGDAARPTRTFGLAQSGIVWLDVVIDGANGSSTPAVPQELSHTIDVGLSKPMPPLLPATMVVDVAPTSVSAHEPAVISPPLDGPRWLDGNSCCDMTAHRMALNPLDGELWAAERFAIDYVQLSEDGTVFRGDRSRPESYPYFGADIHAVADGPVVSVLDGLPEQVAGTAPTGLRLEEYGGNHVVQDISGGGTEKRYAFYAHLKTGSVKVQPGDQLSAGDVLGNLGNSGNTDAPHLHFHVMSTPDPLRADGLPFVFKTFRLDDRMTDQAALDPLLDGRPAPMTPGFSARDETNVSPLVLDVMAYDLG